MREAGVPDTPGGAPDLDPRTVLEACRALGSEMVDELVALVEIETPSTEPSTMEPVFAWLRERLGSVGMACHRAPGVDTAGYLVARPSELGDRPLQLLLGHCDTVWPVGTLETMPVRVEEGVLHGPGTFDMKAGLVQALFALRVLDELGIVPAVAPVMLVNSDEEIGSFESSRAIGQLARISDRCFVMEPSLSPGGRIKTRRKGVFQYEVHVRGKAAHAGLNPEQGASAILELSMQVQRIFDFNDPANGVSVNVGTIDGGMRPNVIAPESRAVVDVRAPTRADAARIDAAMRTLEPSRSGVTVEVVAKGGRPPLEPREPARELWRRARSLGAAMDLDLEEGMAGGGSDGNQTNLYTPTLDGLGAVGDGAHSSHEHVMVDRMPERAALLALLVAGPAVGGQGGEP